MSEEIDMEEALNLIYKALETILVEVKVIKIAMTLEKEDKVFEKKEEKKWRIESPGLGNYKEVEKSVSLSSSADWHSKTPNTDSITSKPMDLNIVNYTKKDGSVGTKAAKDILYNGKMYRYLKDCKYGCGNYTAFDLGKFEAGKKPLHLTIELVPIGFYCPKYADGEEE